MLGKTNQTNQANKISCYYFICTIFLFISVFSLTIQVNLSYKFPNLSEILETTGLNNQDVPLTEKEIQLIELMSKIYETEDDLHVREEKLLNQVGLSKPDGKQKGTLGRMYNTHIINLNKLAALSKQLKQEVADVVSVKQELQANQGESQSLA